MISDTDPARFNSQPPGGGWANRNLDGLGKSGFQLTAARRRLDMAPAADTLRIIVSTHSRPEAAGVPNPCCRC